MEKKGQGLSMTTIVIAALALLVLIVLVLIFTGRMKLFSEGTENTQDCDTFCKSLGHYSGEEYDSATHGSSPTYGTCSATSKTYKVLGFGSKSCACCPKA